MQKKDFEAIYKASTPILDFCNDFAMFLRTADPFFKSPEWFEDIKTSFKLSMEPLEKIESEMTKELLVPLNKLYERFYNNSKLFQKTYIDKDVFAYDIDIPYYESKEFQDLFLDICNDIDNIREKYNLDYDNVHNFDLIIEATATDQLYNFSSFICQTAFTDLTSASPIVFERERRIIEWGAVFMHTELKLDKFRKLARNKEGYIFSTNTNDGIPFYLGSNLPEVQEKFREIEADSKSSSSRKIINLTSNKIPVEYFRSMETVPKSKKAETSTEKKEDKKKVVEKKAEEKQKKDKKRIAIKFNFSFKDFFSKVWHYITLPFISLFNLIKKLFSNITYDFNFISFLPILICTLGVIGVTILSHFELIVPSYEKFIVWVNGLPGKIKFLFLTGDLFNAVIDWTSNMILLRVLLFIPLIAVCAVTLILECVLFVLTWILLGICEFITLLALQILMWLLPTALTIFILIKTIKSISERENMIVSLICLVLSIGSTILYYISFTSQYFN